MKRKLRCLKMLLIILCLVSYATSFAQSDARSALKPVIFGDTLLCPNTGSILHTQKFYDTYQWYKRDFLSNKKQLIEGATTSELVVDDNDVLKYFSVVVTLIGVKRSSDEKLVDALVFLPPTVKSGGDFKNGPGFFVLNEGDTGIFNLLKPYTTNITWYKNNQPIPGATSNKLLVTTGGTYTVKGAPAECPDYIQYLGVDLIVKIKASNKVPVITGDTLLCPNSTGTLSTQQGYSSYQWYKRFFGSNKKLAVAGATSNTITVSANNDAPAYFSVKVTSNGDTLTSEEKLVDSYVFLPPAVISDGDFINGAGYFILNKGDTGTFTLTQPYDTNITWYRNNAVIPSEKSATLYVTEGGNYTVQAAPTVCPNFIQNLGVVLTVKIADGKSAVNADAAKTQLTTQEVKLHPNPAKDFVMIDVASFSGKNIEVSLSAQDGKNLFVKNYMPILSSLKLDLTSIKAGIYYVKISDKQKHQLLKLVVSK